MKKTFKLNLNKKPRRFYAAALSFSLLFGILGLGQSSQAAGSVSSTTIYCNGTACGNYYSIGIITTCTGSSGSGSCTDSESVSLPSTGSDSTYLSNFSLTTNPGTCGTFAITNTGAIFGTSFNCTNSTCNYGGSPSGNSGNLTVSVSKSCLGGFGGGASAGYNLTDCFSGYTATGAGVCTAPCTSTLINSGANQLTWSVLNGSNISIAGVGSGLSSSGTAYPVAPGTYTLTATGCSNASATVLAPSITVTASGATFSVGSNSLGFGYYNSGPAKTTVHVDGSSGCRAIGTGVGVTGASISSCQTVDMAN